jgi:hypothetical protein
MFLMMRPHALGARYEFLPSRRSPMRIAALRTDALADMRALFRQF